MIREVITRIKLTASEGYMLTNGEVYGKEIYIGTKDAAENWQEITEEEAKKLQEQEASVEQ